MRNTLMRDMAAPSAVPTMTASRKPTIARVRVAGSTSDRVNWPLDEQMPQLAQDAVPGRAGCTPASIPTTPRPARWRGRARWLRPSAKRPTRRRARRGAVVGVGQLEGIQAGELACRSPPLRGCRSQACRATSWRRLAVISPARCVRSGSSMRRGRGSSGMKVAATRPGRRREQHDPIGESGRLPHVVGDEEDREPPLLPQPFELVVEQVAGHGVERAERFVHEHDVGVLGERPGQRHPLAHAARQLVGTLVGEALEVDDPEQLGHPVLATAPSVRLATSAPARRCEPRSATGTAPTPGTSSAVRPVDGDRCRRSAGRGRRRGSAASTCRSPRHRSGRRTRRAARRASPGRARGQHLRRSRTSSTLRRWRPRARPAAAHLPSPRAPAPARMA